ncbi:hypothetical protein DERF_002032 [Dermatophagoides farinae]|uniref:Uncharacterized protein n=1 Tax=Dermatophagoides farinae TaxID=6954 RepID=A0A922IEX9_DERFA|nr:hypothetical protein DERF_002032 [Dermatophagoides farinae]
MIQDILRTYEDSIIQMNMVKKKNRKILIKIFFAIVIFHFAKTRSKLPVLTINDNMALDNE